MADNYSNANLYIGDTFIQKKIKNDYNDDGSELAEVPNQELTLRNLGSRLTAEIRSMMNNSDNLINVPYKEFSNENYLGNSQPADLIPSLEPDIGADIDDNGNLIDPGNGKLFNSDSFLNSFNYALINSKLKDRNHPVCDHVSLRVGEAPVINPPWQFNELDDVRSDTIYPHMGRVYLKYIYSNFPILIFQPGREKSNVNFLTFFGKGLGHASKAANNYIRSGGDTNIIQNIGLFLSSAKNVIVGGIEATLGALTGLSFFKASKFMTFKPSFKLFRTIANNLLYEYGANLGLIDLSGEPAADTISFASDTNDIDNEKNNSFDNKDEFDGDGNLYKKIDEGEAYASGSAGQYSVGANPTAGNQKDEVNKNAFGDRIKSVFDGLGISRTKGFVDDKGVFNATYRGTFKKLDILEMIPRMQFANGEKSAWYDPLSWMNAQYLPYLCQNTVTVSETFSNSTEQHPLASQLNSMSQESAQERASGGASTLISKLQGATIDSIADGSFLGSLGSLAVSKALKKGAENMSELGVVINGGGKMLIPEIWSGSSFSRSYSVDFEFWSPVGDIVSIFENTYIPALILMVLAAPIQTGYTSYAAPFCVKVYSKGLFSVDFGMVESLTITRGEEKNDRTFSNFPKTIKVSMSIKDLQPTLMMSVGGGAFWKFSRANTSMNEYIATMCNLTIADRQDLVRQFKVFWSQSINKIRDTFTLDNIGYNFSQSIFMKPVMAWNCAKVNIDQVSKSNRRY